MCAVPLECAPCVRFQSIGAYYPHVNRHQAHHHRGTSSAFSHITRSSRLHSPVAVQMGGLAFLGSAEFSTMGHSLSLSPIRSPDSTTHAIINQTALVASAAGRAAPITTICGGDSKVRGALAEKELSPLAWGNDPRLAEASHASARPVELAVRH